MRATTLAAALGVATGDVVAFVGAGGKTSAMFRLADEIAAAGGRIVTTTTTRLAAAEATRAQAHVRSLAALPAALATARHVLLTGGIDAAADKALGVDPAALCALRLPGITLLVEADGSRRLPFKAPAEHEPSVPPCATLVVWVVGVDAVGQPLDAAHVHRPERVARIHPGAVVTPGMVAAVAGHPHGGGKNVPPGARVVLLINKADDAGRLSVAQEIAARVPAGGRIARVALVSLGRRERAVIEVTDKEAVR